MQQPRHDESREDRPQADAGRERTERARRGGHLLHPEQEKAVTDTTEKRG